MIIVSVSLLYYLRVYLVSWPKLYSDQWQYGYKQAIEFVKKYYTDSNEILVTESQGRPYIYFLFYNQFDPVDYWQKVNKIRDEFYFIMVNSFDKYKFVSNIDEDSLMPKTLIIMPAGDLPYKADKLKTIFNLRGDPVFDIGLTK